MQMKTWQNLKKIEGKVYTIHTPTRFDEFNKKNHPYGCTIAITRNNSFWKKSESIDLIDYENKDLSFANKSVILKNEDQYVTCITDRGRRLDYVLTSTIGYMPIKKMSYIDSFRLSELSDHSGIFFEI